MTCIRTLSETLSNDRGSVDDVLQVIGKLVRELRDGRLDDWENPTLERFLDAMQAWLEAVGPQVDGKPSWKFIELMVQAAKVYE